MQSMKRFVPHSHIFKVWYAVVIVLAGVVGYQTVHGTSAQSLPSNKVQLQMSKQSYKVGEVVRYTIVNGLTNAILVANNCPNEPLMVFRQQQGTWVRIHDTATNSDKCLSEPRSYAIVPNAQVSSTYLFWPKLFNTPGRYQIVAPVEGYANGPSAEFEVVAQ